MVRWHKERMSRQESESNMLEASRLYADGLAKSVIAKALDVHPGQITRWLKAAKDKYWKLVYTPPTRPDLEHRLVKRFPCLRETVVVTSARDAYSTMLLRAKALSEYFDQHVEDGTRVAVAGGTSMYEMIVRLPDRPRDIEIYPSALNSGRAIAALGTIFRLPDYSAVPSAAQ